MQLVSYTDHLQQLPINGRHIVGTFTSKSIVVYQAFDKAIAIPALKQNIFVPPFSYSRLSWIKPNFMWMMYRCNWGLNNDYVLAIHLDRQEFESILRQAIYTQFSPEKYDSARAWRAAMKKSNVRVQWDPDHGPDGKSLDRRAIQLGLSGDALRHYARKSINKIEDVSDFVRSQRRFAHKGDVGSLRVPLERVYQPNDLVVREYLGLDSF
jgi:hypothetical protein